jgi:hypothetical protein
MAQAQNFKMVDAFEPAALERMAIAFNDICRILKIRDDYLELREVIASDVIRLGRSGACDAATIRDLVLAKRTSVNFQGRSEEQNAPMEKRYENRSDVSRADSSSVAPL